MATNHTPSIPNPALPYFPYGNVTGDAPRYIAGSNCMTSMRGVLERRPGFSPFENSPTTLTSIRRCFTWQRWNGSFFVMVCDVTATQSIVYKMEVGVDSSLVSIFTSSSTEPFDFVVSSNFVFFGNGTDMKKYNGTTVTNWGITAPAAAPTHTLSGTGITLTTGRKYVYAYENSGTGGLSSSSPESLTTGAVANQQVNITTVASTDPQVTGIRIFATTDGGGGVYFEISATAFPNTAGPHVDTTADVAMKSTTAPTGGVNDRPPLSYGFVWHANRIWMIEKGTNKVWFTGWEEIRNGFEEECVPSGGAGNFWQVDAEALGLSICEDGVLIFTAGKIHKITGDTLDTFDRTILAEGLGIRNRACIARHSKVTGFLEASGSIWTTDGFSFEEIGIPILTDLKGINHATCSMAVHIEDDRRWLLLCDGDDSTLRVFDLRTGQWMPPWPTVSGIRTVYSGETDEGDWTLFIAATKLLAADGSYRDDGAAFSASVTSNLHPMRAKMDGRAHLKHLGIEHNTVELKDVSILVDDNPQNVAFSSIVNNKKDAFNREQGVSLKEHWYHGGQSTVDGKRIAFKLDFPATAENFEVFALDVCTEARGME